jgi:hypothetical protein
MEESGHSLLLWPNPSQRPSQLPVAGSSHGAVILGELPVFLTPLSVDRGVTRWQGMDAQIRKEQ